jgi:hypothetical protein
LLRLDCKGIFRLSTKRESLSQLDYGGAAAALILRRGRVAFHMRMIGEQFSNSSAQRAGAVAVDYADFALTVQESGVEKLVDQISSLVSCLADEVEFI